MHSNDPHNPFPQLTNPLVLPPAAFAKGEIPVLVGLDGTWRVDGDVVSNGFTGDQIELAQDWIDGITGVLSRLPEQGTSHWSIGDDPRTRMHFTWLGAGLVWVQLVTVDAKGDPQGLAQLGLALPWTDPEEQQDLLDDIDTPTSVANLNDGLFGQLIADGWLELWRQINRTPVRPFCWMSTPHTRGATHLDALRWAAVHIAISACLPTGSGFSS